MAGAKNHDYHILPPSIWPFVGAMGGFVMLLGAVLWMHDGGPYPFLIGLVAVLFTTGVWSPARLSATTSDHQPNMVNRTATSPIRNR